MGSYILSLFLIMIIEHILLISILTIKILLTINSLNKKNWGFIYGYQTYQKVCTVMKSKVFSIQSKKWVQFIKIEIG